MGILWQLEQDQIWIDKDGNEHRLEDMSVRYKENVVALLMRKAHIIENFEAMAALSLMGRMSEAAQDAMGTEMFGDIMNRDSEAWMANKPLVKALNAQIKANIGPPSYHYAVWYGGGEMVEVEAEDEGGAIKAAQAHVPDLVPAFAQAVQVEKDF